MAASPFPYSKEINEISIQCRSTGTSKSLFRSPNKSGSLQLALSLNPLQHYKAVFVWTRSSSRSVITLCICWCFKQPQTVCTWPCYYILYFVTEPNRQVADFHQAPSSLNCPTTYSRVCLDSFRLLNTFRRTSNVSLDLYMLDYASAVPL